MRFAISVSNLAPSQLSFYAIDNANKYLREHPYDDIVIFTEDLSVPCLVPHFSVIQIYEQYAYENIVIATNITTARKTINSPSPIKKYFYVWDLEWCRNHNQYDELCKVYRDEELNLIARSSEHAKIISGVWDRKVVGIVEDFDLCELTQIIKG